LDEALWECKPEYADIVGKLGVASIVKAGEYLKLNIPLAAEYKVGKSWAEVH
jgi:DNA polymerase I-like protein with 3'-5' exonuclease and polymerase domains